MRWLRQPYAEEHLSPNAIREKWQVSEWLWGRVPQASLGPPDGGGEGLHKSTLTAEYGPNVGYITIDERSPQPGHKSRSGSSLSIIPRAVTFLLNQTPGRQLWNALNGAIRHTDNSHRALHTSLSVCLSGAASANCILTLRRPRAAVLVFNYIAKQNGE